jgi:hypothetical protein
MVVTFLVIVTVRRTFFSRRRSWSIRHFLGDFLILCPIAAFYDHHQVGFLRRLQEEPLSFRSDQKSKGINSKSPSDPGSRQSKLSVDRVLHVSRLLFDVLYSEMA